MNRRTSKVRDYRQPIRPNIGLIVFGFIFIYILIYVLRYFYSERVAIYEVVKSSISENNEFKGVIYRNETVIKSEEAGNVTYYVATSSRVAKDDMIFSIDEGANNNSNNLLKSKGSNVEIKDSDYETISDDIEYYRNIYNDSDFTYSYTFINDITNRILELNTGALYDNIEELIKDAKAKNIVVGKSKISGLISYTVDGMENISKDKINDDVFNSKTYNRVTNTSGELLEKDVPVYKIVEDDVWNIAIKLNKSQYEKLKEKDSIGVIFKSNNFTTDANVDFIRNNGKYYGILTLDEYLINFIEDRYIDIQLAMNTATGLKIPNSSIVEKDFYVVPKKCFTKGGNSDSQGLIVEQYEKNGKVNNSFVETVIYYDDEESYYIDSKLFDLGTSVVIPDSNDKYTLNNIDSLQGVYCVNKGYCEFKNIIVKYSSDEYTIVEENSDVSMPISKYDHIVYDVTKDIESKIIY